MRMKQSTYYTKSLQIFATWRWKEGRGELIESCGDQKLVMKVRLGSCLGTSEEEKIPQSAFSLVQAKPTESTPCRKAEGGVSRAINILGFGKGSRAALERSSVGREQRGSGGHQESKEEGFSPTSQDILPADDGIVVVYISGILSPVLSGCAHYPFASCTY